MFKRINIYMDIKRKTLTRIVDNINQENYSVLQYFPDYDFFCKILDKYNLLSKLEFIKLPIDSVNEIMLSAIKVNPKLILNRISSECIVDIEEISGEYYYKIGNDLTDISDLFEDKNYNIIKSTFSEDFIEIFDNMFSYINPYENVISNLNDQNINYLCEAILEKLEGFNLATDDIQHLIDLSEEQDNDGSYVQITDINIIKKILEDEESTLALLREVNDIEIDIIHSFDSAINNIAIEEIKEIVMDELSELFEPKILSINNNYYLKFKKDELVYIIKKFLEESWNDIYYDPYLSSMLDEINSKFKLDLYYFDANYYEAERQINDYFYID